MLSAAASLSITPAQTLVQPHNHLTKKLTQTTQNPAKPVCLLTSSAPQPTPHLPMQTGTTSQGQELLMPALPKTLRPGYRNISVGVPVTETVKKSGNFTPPIYENITNSIPHPEATHAHLLSMRRFLGGYQDPDSSPVECSTHLFRRQLYFPILTVNLLHLTSKLIK